MRTGLFAAAFAAVLAVSAGVAKADELIESYGAYIGQDDLYNSNNERLTQPWQVIRQDRANVHRFGVSQPGDDRDNFFASPRNRELAERMIRSGRIDRSAATVPVTYTITISWAEKDEPLSYSLSVAI